MLELENIKSLCHRIGVSRATVYRLLAAGSFPVPVRLSKRCVRWRTCDIDA